MGRLHPQPQRRHQTLSETRQPTGRCAVLLSAVYLVCGLCGPIRAGESTENPTWPASSVSPLGDMAPFEPLPAGTSYLPSKLLTTAERRIRPVSEMQAAQSGRTAPDSATTNGAGQPAEEFGIQDNSFLVEEAYNQEPGVVQHIFNWVWTWDHGAGSARTFDFLFTQEWPIGSQLHQFSYTLPFSTFVENPDNDPAFDEEHFGDMQLNYRLQLAAEVDGWPAIAPRFSLILPTGNEHEGLGEGEIGYQFNLPISKELGSFAFHANASLTIFPDVDHRLPAGDVSPHHDLIGYNLGFSAILIASPKVQPMLELVAFWTPEIADDGGVDVPFEFILSPGVRYAPYTAKSKQIVVGAAAPIGLSDDAPDIGLFVYLSIEHPFQNLSDEESEARSGGLIDRCLRRKTLPQN